MSLCCIHGQFDIIKVSLFLLTISVICYLYLYFVFCREWNPHTLSRNLLFLLSQVCYLCLKNGYNLVTAQREIIYIMSELHHARSARIYWNFSNPVAWNSRLIRSHKSISYKYKMTVQQYVSALSDDFYKSR